jgi:uncharacterized membrane protein
MNREQSLIKGFEKNVGQAERILSAAAGGYLLYKSLTGQKKGIDVLAAGYLLFRGATGYCPAYGALKMDRNNSQGNINVRSFITTNKPVNEVYNFWRKLDNLPNFMKHLESVTVLDEKHHMWKAKIPGDLGTIDWKSEIISEVQDEYIAWKSVPGSQIENAGTVEFKDAGKFGTEVHIELSYYAPAGIVGEALAKLLNPLLETMIHEDIKNFRKYLETGEIPTYEGQPTGK